MKKLLLSLALLVLLFSSVTPAGTLAEEQSLKAPPPQWQQLFPPTSPSPRSSHAMAYDTARDKAVLFGGADNGGNELGDTWEWDSASRTWSQRFPAHSPSPRQGHALAYDEARGVTVFFGGSSGVPSFSDTWLWDGNDWTQVFPTTTPPAREYHAMVYDSQRQVVVLFGGIEFQRYDDTWEWDGTNWTEQLIVGPSPRSRVGMAYDPRRNVTVLFGGNDGSGFFQDTWERAGEGPWQGVIVSRHPSRRAALGAAYFPRLRQVVLFGGTKFEFYDDTWLWDGQAWRTRSFDPRPSARCCYGMVYDPVLRGVLLFGGSASFIIVNDTWLFR